MDQMQTRIRNPPTSVPSSKPTLTKRRSRAKTLPSWFMVAPQRKRRLTWSKIVVVLASPTCSRKVKISERRRCVRLIQASPRTRRCKERRVTLMAFDSGEEPGPANGCQPRLCVEVGNRPLAWASAVRLCWLQATGWVHEPVERRLLKVKLWEFAFVFMFLYSTAEVYQGTKEAFAATERRTLAQPLVFHFLF